MPDGSAANQSTEMHITAHYFSLQVLITPMDDIRALYQSPNGALTIFP
jgi:hypothetical protein